MINLVRTFLILTFFLSSLLVVSTNNINIENTTFNRVSDDEVVKHIAHSIKEDYKNMKDKTFQEKMIIQAGQKSFFSSLDIWIDNYKEIEKIDTSPKGHLLNMSSAGWKYLDNDEALRFEGNLMELTFLGYQNLDLFYRAVKSHLTEKSILNINYISVTLIDEAITKEVYYNEKLDLYRKERIVKKEIEDTLNSKELRYRLGFYLFAFRFLNNIREKIIEKDIKKMNQIIQNQFSTN